MRSRSRRTLLPGLLRFAPIALAACAAHAPPPAPTSELATDRTEYTGWQTLQPSGPPSSETELRAQLVERRRDLLNRCDEVVVELEDRRRAMGSVPAQILTGVVASTAAGIASNSTLAATGQPVQPALPAPAGVDVSQNVRLGVRIGEIRSGMHALVTARTYDEIFVAMDRLNGKCGPASAR